MQRCVLGSARQNGESSKKLVFKFALIKWVANQPSFDVVKTKDISAPTGEEIDSGKLYDVKYGTCQSCANGYVCDQQLDI